MLDRRRTLTLLTGSLALIAIVGLSTPFFLSLWPTKQAEASLPRIDVSEIQPGQLIVLKNPIGAQVPYVDVNSVLFYRSRNGQLMAWHAITKDGLVMMPDVRWWKGFYPCKEFGLIATESDNRLIACQDNESEGVSRWWSEQWRWHVTGENVAGEFDDLEPIKGAVVGDYFVFGKRI